MRIRLIFLFLFGAFLSTPASAIDSLFLQLFGRAKVDGYSVGLDESDWIWLRSKGRLVLGISAPDYGPFEVTANDQGFEGITADYAGLLGQLLHVKVEVRRYGSRSEVILALKNGEVDLIGTSNAFEASDHEISMSTSYAEDQPVLVTRSGDNEILPSGLDGKKVTMLYHYLPPEVVSSFYPNADLRLYPSTLSAIGAVAFGQADVYLGDSISANYLINKNYLNNVQLADFSRLGGRGFFFALAHGNTQLLRIVNSALEAIPASERTSILRRWNAQGVQVPGLTRLQFSPEEQRWMENHPRLKVAINEHLSPLSYFDEQGELRGITADVLTQIRLLTGLKFEVLRSNSATDLIEWVGSGKADILAAISPSSSRANELDFSRPYLTTPFVLVSQVGSDRPNTLDDMAGKTLVLARGCVMHEFLTNNYPRIRLDYAENGPAAMAMVSQGKADAAVVPFISARYLISRKYRDILRVTSTVGTVPAQIAFATTRGDPELDSILSKALLSITPEEMDALINRWRSDMVVEDSYWARNRTAIIQFFFIAVALLLVALVWIVYLRKLISNKVKAEHALSDQLEFMRALIDGTPHPIYVSDREGRLLICNSSYLDVYGVRLEVVLGKNLIEGAAGHSDEMHRFHQDAMEVMRQGLPQVQDRPLSLPNGSILTIYHWMLPYRTTDGEVSGMIGGWIDISDRQLLLEQLQEAKQGADDANRAKTTFLATMSHEIRTPMNAVIGMLELMLKKTDEGIIDRTAIEVASSAAHDLLGLIGDILDIARIESGRLSLTPERANVQDLVESVIRTLDGLARQKCLNLVLDLDANSDCSVMIDPLRFKQVLSNLLSNAIKFTAKGEVRVMLRVQPTEQKGYKRLCLRVEDTGEGISDEDQLRLFNPFTQVGNNTQSARSGSGLGLVICRTLCEMMNGQLHLSSVLGSGTRVEVGLIVPELEPVYVQLPMAAESALTDQILNILVVDDYSANRMLLSQQLSYLGHCVRDAADGAQGLRDWGRNRFDVVITDCNMPIMNGYELARAIRKQEQASGAKPCRILGLTASAQPEEKGRCIDAGMDDCLFKPIGLQGLKACLASIEPLCQQDAKSDLSNDLSIGVDGIDLFNLKQLTHGDPAVIKGLLDDLASSMQTDLDLLLKLFVRNDLTGLADLAHRVKGGARIIKAHGLIACCEQLEVVCANQDSTLLTSALDDLQQAMERMVQLLGECDVEKLV